MLHKEACGLFGNTESNEKMSPFETFGGSCILFPKPENQN